MPFAGGEGLGVQPHDLPSVQVRVVLVVQVLILFDPLQRAQPLRVPGASKRGPSISELGVFQEIVVSVRAIPSDPDPNPSCPAHRDAYRRPHPGHYLHQGQNLLLEHEQLLEVPRHSAVHPVRTSLESDSLDRAPGVFRTDRHHGPDRVLPGREGHGGGIVE